MKEDKNDFMNEDLSFKIGDNLATELMNAKQKLVGQEEIVSAEDCKELRDIIDSELYSEE